MKFQYNDGGRAAAGFKGKAGDCVTRAVVIASGKPYAEVYAALAAGNAAQRKTKNRRATGKTARNGIHTDLKWFKDFMRSLGFTWTPTMLIGQGCKVHLTDGELPMGRLVVSVSGHYTAVIDGVIQDTFRDCILHAKYLLRLCPWATGLRVIRESKRNSSLSSSHWSSSLSPSCLPPPRKPPRLLWTKTSTSATPLGLGPS